MNTLILRKAFAFALLLICALPLSAQTIIRVDPASTDSSPNGATWSKAYRTLSAALKAIPAGQQTQIWVAANQLPYIPDPTGLTDPREATFKILDKMQLYGGFRGLASGGGETSLNQRNPGTNITVLSGDLARNDTSSEATRSENVYHVVYTYNAKTSIIDGFTITGGNASGPSTGDKDKGGGILNLDGMPSITNCKIIENMSSNLGGGLSNRDAWPKVVDCVFQNNKGLLGGAVHNWFGYPVYTNCVFTGNVSTATTSGGGGAVYNEFCMATFSNCTFVRNNSGYDGGAALTRSNDYGNGKFTTFPDCLFIENTCANAGAGVYNVWDVVKFNRCTFIGNNGSRHGGGMFNSGGAPEVKGCIFAANSTQIYGSSVYNNYCDAILQNCLMVGNYGSFGTGVFNSRQETTSPSILNCTIADNWAESAGGGGISNLYSNPVVTNTILWGTRVMHYSYCAKSQIDFDFGNPVATNCCIQDCNPDDASIPLGGTANNNIDDDPQFAASGSGTWTSNAAYSPTLFQTLLTCVNANWKPDAFKNHMLRPSDTSYRQTLITGNTATQITVLGDFTSLGSAGQHFQIKNYRLHYTSPCLNTGNNSAIPIDMTQDLDGGSRIINGIVDRGAYEKPASHPADFDADGDVDENDFQSLVDCAAGPMLTITPNCTDRDLDHDNDVDATDFGMLQRCFSGAGQSAQLNCL